MTEESNNILLNHSSLPRVLRGHCYPNDYPVGYLFNSLGKKQIWKIRKEEKNVSECACEKERGKRENER